MSLMLRSVYRIIIIFIGLMLLCNVTATVTAIELYSCQYCHETSESCYTDETGAIYCKEKLMKYPKDQEIEVYYVKDGTHYIAEEAFSANPYIRQVIIPEGVVKIGECAFESCFALERVELPQSLMIIESGAFSVCTSLSEVRMSEGIYAIGDSAFSDCWNLKALSLPETLRFIGTEAFAVSGLEEVYIHTIDLITGSWVFPRKYDEDTLTIHLPRVMIEEEAGMMDGLLEELRTKKYVSIHYDLSSSYDIENE